MAKTIEQDSSTVLLLTLYESRAMLQACIARLDDPTRSQSEAVHLGRVIRSFSLEEQNHATEAVARIKRTHGPSTTSRGQ